jgi:predicted DsbA family dithiol-disulfide isomerase
VQVEVWSDVVCPWCLLGTRRLQRALAGWEHAAEVEVVLRSFELDPAARAGGGEPTLAVLARKYGRSEAEMAEGMTQLVELGREEGLALRPLDTVHTSSRDAHRLLHLALAEGGPALQRTLGDALHSAYFEHARDIGDHAVLSDVATTAGLDADRVQQVLTSDELDDAVAADVDQARAYGVSGVPFFVLDSRLGVSGAQPVEVLVQALDQAWSARA